MALVRLCVTFFLLVYLKVTYGNQNDISNIVTGLCYNNNIGTAQQILQRRAALLSESQNCNKNINGNIGTTAGQQLQNNQAGLVQGNSQGNFQANNQYGTPQQQCSLQQAVNTQLPLNLQQPATNQNQHQVYISQNFQRPQAQNCPQQSNIQNPQKQCIPNQHQQISVNPSYQQSQNLQNNVNLQPQVVQQQQTSTLLNSNPCILGQSASPQSDIPLASMVNRQIAGLPAQVSQGTLLSHLGLQSNLPTLLPNLFDSKQTVYQNNFVNNAQADVTSMLNRPQTSFQPLSVASQQCPLMPNDQQNIVSVKNQFNQYTPNRNLPVQPQFVPLQNQLAIAPPQSQFIPYSVQGQPVTTLQSQPLQGQTMATSVPYQSAPQAQNQLVYSSVPIQNNPMIQSQSTSVSASQYPQFPNRVPEYPNNLSGFQNKDGISKTSSMKQLLPLLFNLLKEKSCCACHKNQNCGCVNNNNPTFRDQSPQVVGGYSQNMKNVPAVVNTATNMIDSEEEDDDDTIWRLKKYKNYNDTKTRHDDASAEEEDDEDSAEDNN